VLAARAAAFGFFWPRASTPALCSSIHWSSFDFFRASAAGEHIEKIYLAGGSSKVPGLVEALRQEFSLPVEIFNPFQKIMPPADGMSADLIEQNAGQMAVAVGLALRSFDDL